MWTLSAGTLLAFDRLIGSIFVWLNCLALNNQLTLHALLQMAMRHCYSSQRGFYQGLLITGYQVGGVMFVPPTERVRLSVQRWHWQWPVHISLRCVTWSRDTGKTLRGIHTGVISARRETLTATRQWQWH